MKREKPSRQSTESNKHKYIMNYIPYSKVHIDELYYKRKNFRENGDVDNDLKNSTIKDFGEWCKHRPAQYISKKALSKAIEMGIDIKTFTWDNQPKFDEHRKIFHFEHTTPKSMLFEMVFYQDIDIEEILKQHIVCLILKEEDKALTDAGFRSKRPCGWQECYHKCGIEFEEID